MYALALALVQLVTHFIQDVNILMDEEILVQIQGAIGVLVPALVVK